MEDDLKKVVEECKYTECKDHTIILYKGLSNQRTTWMIKEEVDNEELMIATLKGLPGSLDSFMRGMCARKKRLLSVDSGKKKKLDS